MPSDGTIGGLVGKSNSARAQFEAEWSKQECGWKFGKRVIDA
jgi:hypothetical protein